MTVTSQTTKVTTAGNGSTFTFSFSPMVIFASTDIVVTSTVIATGVETTLTEGSGSSNYSVGITTYPATGSITYPADEGTPIESTVNITIKRVLTLEQQTDLSNQGGYFADTQETQFDKLVMLDLQQQEEIDRSFTFPLTYTGSGSSEIPAPSANSYIRWNSGGTALENTTGASGVQTVPDGSESAPGLAFEDDTNTGWFRIGADNIGMSLGGTKRVDYSTTKAIFTTTVEPGGDTAAGDNAAIGYTAAEGLILTGQGSTNDVTVKNDADTDVISIPTGGTQVDFAGNLTATDLTLSGDLTVNGSTVTMDITNQVSADPLIELNNGAASNANDLGVVMERGSTGNNVFMGWDESADEFVAGLTTATGTSTGNITFSGYANAQFLGITGTTGTFTGEVTGAGFTGTLDGILGGGTPAAATATTITANTSLALATGATVTGINDTDNMSDASATTLATSESTKAYTDASLGGNPMTTQGDIVRGAASGALERLAAGTANQVLAHDATDANWVTFEARDITWSGSQKSTVTTLTSTSNSIAISMLTTNDYSHTFTENTTLANPSDTLVAGQSGVIYLTQHASSPKTLAFGSEYDFVGGTVPVVTATNSARDTLHYCVREDGKIEITALLNQS